MIKAYKTNICVLPTSKNKIIGDTSKFFLFGKVLDVGSEVSKEIEVGDTIHFTLWGLTESVAEDGSKTYFVQDNADFILGIEKNGQ